MEYNVKLFAFVLSLFFLLNIVSALERGEVFVLTLKYDQGNVSVASLVKTEGYFAPPIDKLAKGYLLEVISSEGKLLYRQYFDFNLEMNTAADPSWFDEKGNQVYFPTVNETHTLLERASIEIIFPYFKEASKINVKNPVGKEIISFRVNSDKALEIQQRFFWKEAAIVAVLILIIFIIFLVLRRKRLKSSGY